LFSGIDWEKKLYSHGAIQFFYLQKKFQKFRTKIEIVGTCPKSHLSPRRDNGPLGVKSVTKITISTILEKIQME